jgi:3-phenylpropionate/trans-cinnamate dioxygenase ferredoxin reductase component
MPSYDYLIVGGGMTADAAARGIREVDNSGSIGILSSEADAPYSRPPLTKALWKGDAFDSVWRKTSETGAELHLSTNATAIDARAKAVTDIRGDRFGYGKLLLATGGAPRHLPSGAEAVIYFRTLEDYRRVRARSDAGARFAVLGGGFIGSELAAALAMNGRAVTMIVPEDGVGARIFPPDLADNVTEYYRGKGVEVRAKRLVSDIAEREGKLTLRTSDGESVTADAAVAGLGIVPNVALARSAGIVVSDGIDVDGRLCTSERDIFAAGDVASFEARPLGRRLRVEHEDNALTMGRAAGRSMAGDDAPYEHLPFFYSDLFELGYEAVGLTDSRLETVSDWKQPFREGVVYYLEGGRVRGVLLWNVWNQVDAARALIAEPGPFTAAKLKSRLPA